MRLRPHPGGVRGKAEGADSADERGAESNPVPDEGHHTAGYAHQETAANLGIPAASPGRDKLQYHRQGCKGEPAYRGQALWDSAGDAGVPVK